MIKYNKQSINNRIVNVQSAGSNQNEIQDVFLMMVMNNDLGEERPFICKAPSLHDIQNLLMDSGEFDAEDVSYELVGGMNLPDARLMVKIGPSCQLYITSNKSYLSVSVNDTAQATLSFCRYKASDIAEWVVRQKQKLQSYLNGWDQAYRKASKKIKNVRLSTLAIKAIFLETMRQYPGVEYEIMVQARRVRFRVRMPNSKLGVYIDAWYGSYKEKLPQQLEDLKVLIEAYKKTSIQNFYFY